MAKEEMNAFLGAGTAFQGVLKFQGGVRIDGSFEGEIHSDGVLIIGKEAKIHGKVSVGEVNMYGTCDGDIVVKRRAVFYKGSILRGNIQSPALIVEEGATIEGSISMKESSSQPK